MYLHLYTVNVDMWQSPVLHCTLTCHGLMMSVTLYFDMELCLVWHYIDTVYGHKGCMQDTAYWCDVCIDIAYKCSVCETILIQDGVFHDTVYRVEFSVTLHWPRVMFSMTLHIDMNCLCATVYWHRVMFNVTLHTDMKCQCNTVYWHGVVFSVTLYIDLEWCSVWHCILIWNICVTLYVDMVWC